MYDHFHAIWRKRMDFMVNGSRVEYLARCIWITMQVHMVTDEFTQNGMKYNSSISAAFMRLTKVTGGNAAAGVAGLVAALENKLKNLDNMLKEVKKDAAAARTRATTASNVAEDAKTKLAKLYQANPILKKRHLSPATSQKLRITADLRPIEVFGGLVVVAQQWPSSLISILALGLPLLGGYFPTKLHGYFNLSKAKLDHWHSIWDFCAPTHTAATYLLSGGVNFLRRGLAVLGGSQRVIVTVEWSRRSASRPSLAKALRAGHALLSEFELLPWVVADSVMGGVMDAQYLFGLGRALGLSLAPSVAPRLPRTICHILDGGVEGR
jgi:hypothetical protein